MTRLNVLVTSSYYWPEDTANAPYVTGLAEHLSERGHNVVVATGFEHYPDWKSSARGRLAASETHNGVRICRRWHYVPRTQSAAHRAAYELSLIGLRADGVPAPASLESGRDRGVVPDPFGGRARGSRGKGLPGSLRSRVPRPRGSGCRAERRSGRSPRCRDRPKPGARTRQACGRRRHHLRRLQALP